MKVLFIGHYKENSGWGNAARDYILALSRAKVDVVCRPVLLNNTIEVSDEIKELENKSSKGCNVCVQMVLPHYLEKGPFKKNICIYFTETKNLEFTSWISRINLMDEAWVCNQQMVDMPEVTIPKKLVHCPFDSSKLEQFYEPMIIPDAQDSFNMYFIGEFNVRKRIPALLRAFHLEFSPSENVNLVIKTSKFGYSPQQVHQELEQMCLSVKQQLKLYPATKYKQELLIPYHMPFNQLYGLHIACHCFVTASYGEAWNIPAFEAKALGNQVIAPDEGGHLEYLCPDTNHLVEGTYEPVFGMTESFYDLYSGREKWFNVSILSLQEKMRIAYEEFQYGRNRNFLEGKKLSERFSYETIGNQMKILLQDSKND